MQDLVMSIRNFLRDEEGASAVEYGVLVALIIVVCIAAIAIIGTQLNIAFQTVADCLKSPSTC